MKPGVLFVSLLLAAWTYAADPSDSPDERLHVIYQRIHFSQQYPPEAAQYIQGKLQGSGEPLNVLAELARDNRSEVRVLVTLLLGEYGEADGAKTLWQLMRDDSEALRLGTAAALQRLKQFTSFPVSTEPL